MSRKLPIETLMEEVKPVVTEKDEFQYPDKSLKNTLCKIRTMRIILRGSKSATSQPHGLPHIKSFGLGP